MSDKFVLWVERSLSAHVTSFWIENLTEFGKFADEPFAYYEVIPTGTESTAVKWSVTFDDFERFGAAETANQAREKILTALAEGGVDLQSLTHYAMSPIHGMFTDNSASILQQFEPAGWVPSGTLVINWERKHVSVHSVEDQKIETVYIDNEMRTQVDRITFIRQYLSRLHPELLGTEEVAELIGWDKRKVASYWRQKRFAFPDLFVGGQPTWNEEKQQWEGGGRPLWRLETVEPWREK